MLICCSKIDQLFFRPVPLLAHNLRQCVEIATGENLNMQRYFTMIKVYGSF